MSDVRKIIRDKVKDAVEKKLEDIFREFLTKEFVEQKRYRELLAVWLIAHPELWRNSRILELECHHCENCNVGDDEVLNYEYIKAIIRDVLKTHEQEIITSAQNALDDIIKNPSSVDEKIMARQVYSGVIESLQEGIRKYLESDQELLDTVNFEVEYESAQIKPSETLSKAAGVILGHDRKVVEHFEQELSANIKVLSPSTKLAILILSTYPKMYRGISFNVSAFDVIWEVISQGKIKLSGHDYWRVNEELYKSGLIVYCSSRYGDKNIVPPFALDIWKNAVNIREIISDVPPEVVERVRTILSWRGYDN